MQYSRKDGRGRQTRINRALDIAQSDLVRENIQFGIQFEHYIF